MNIFYVLLVVFCSCAVRLGNAIPADIKDWNADGVDLQGKRDFVVSGMVKKCSPGLWCYNGKRGITEENPPTAEQNPAVPGQITLATEKPRIERTQRKYKCKAGLHCNQRDVIAMEKRSWEQTQRKYRCLAGLHCSARGVVMT